MGDIDRLLSAFASGALLRPSPEVPNIVDLARAVALLADTGRPTPSPGARKLAKLIGPADHLIFILADGLGMNLLRQLPATAFLSRHLAAELQTVFPSSTATALTTIATAEWPGQHAVTGWWTHVHEVGVAVALLPFTIRSDGRSADEVGVTSEQALPLSSVIGDMQRDVLALFPKQIGQSVYSSYFTGGRPSRGYRSLREAVDAIQERVFTAQAPTYTYLYLPHVDEAAHRFGAERPEVRRAIVEVDLAVERLKTGIGDRGRIVVCADHGFLDAPVNRKHQIWASDSLARLLRFPPSGDARVLYLHVHDGAEGPIRDYFQRRHGERFAIITIHQAEALHLFGPGPIAPRTRARLGDLLALSLGPDVIEYRHVGTSPRIVSQVSHHSGLTPSEMLVPLIIA